MLWDGFARHTPTLDNKSAVRLIVVDTALLPHAGELITQMAEAHNWLEVGDSIDDIVEAAFETVGIYYNLMLLGMVNQFLGTVPSGWLALDGATHDEADYPELHAVLPASMKTGSDFTLPDMTEAIAFGTNTPAEVGDTGGSNATTLTIGQLPAHDHSYTPPVLNIDLEGVGVPDIMAAGVGIPTVTGSTGSGDSIDNRPSFVKVLFAVYSGRV